MNYEEFFLKNKKRYRVKELKKIFKIESNEEIKKILKELELKGIILYDEEKELVMAFPKDHNLFQGVIHINNKNKGFIDKYYIPQNFLNGALSGDTVLIKYQDYLDKNSNKYLAEVIKVIKSKRDYYIATFDGLDINLYGIKGTKELKLNKNERNNLLIGDRLVIKINKDNTVEIVDFIGHKDDPNLELLTIAKLFDIPTEFSKETIEEVNNIKNIVDSSDLIGRKDFTLDNVFTIDCDNTKDMDDAVCVKKKNNGNYELQVHIADVAYYVKKDSNIYKDALLRCNSTYMLDSVLPMLPKKLSNGICSLNPNQIRLTRSTIMEITPSGEIIDFYITKGYIISKKKMSYSKVNMILEDNICPDDYLAFKDDLLLMKELSNILKMKFLKNGEIDFELGEISAKQDNLGEVIEFKNNTQRTAEKIIENFMISANICNANYCTWYNIPTIYRTHESPEIDKIQNTINFIKGLGYRIKNIQNVSNSKVLQGILNELSVFKEYPILSKLILRSMQKARYSVNNIGHYALSLESYAHSTSPIRRIADLEMQYALDNFDNYCNNINNENLTYVEESLRNIASRASYREINSKEAENEAILLQMAIYMSNHIGEDFNGYIIDINDYGILVQCSNNVIGKVNFKDVLGDYYEYDKIKKCVRGRKNKVIYKIGDNVLVKVLNTSKEYKTVYFTLISHLKEKELKKNLSINNL